MTRRQFLGGMVALSVAWLTGLRGADLRGLLRRCMTHPPRQARYITATTLASLAELYKKTNMALLEALKHSTPEMEWMRGLETRYSGHENRIELRFT